MRDAIARLFSRFSWSKDSEELSKRKEERLVQERRAVSGNRKGRLVAFKVWMRRARNSHIVQTLPQHPYRVPFGIQGTIAHSPPSACHYKSSNNFSRSMYDSYSFATLCPLKTPRYLSKFVIWKEKRFSRMILAPREPLFPLHWYPFFLLYVIGRFVHFILTPLFLLKFPSSFIY